MTAHDKHGDANHTHFATIRIYIDGERNASLVFSPSLAIGVGFGDPAAPWATSLFGRGSSAGAWFSNLRVPFTRSIRISMQQQLGAPDYRLFFIARGAENLGINIGGIEISLPRSRLVLHTVTASLQPLEFMTVAKEPNGTSGLVLMHTLAVSTTT